MLPSGLWSPSPSSLSFLRFYCFSVLAALALLTGCHRTPLEVRSNYLYPDDLASSQVKTPDPCRLCFVGRQIVIRWRLPKRCVDEHLYLKLTVRYGNGEEASYTRPVTQRYGWCSYQLLNDDYWRLQDILSYKVELFHGNDCLDLWRHHVWAELIDIPVDGTAS